MLEIKTFSFNRDGVKNINDYKFGEDWPVVYIIENGKELYVGETTRAPKRTRDHLNNTARAHLKNIHIITDEESNMSATKDIESSLIEYFIGDNKFTLQNKSRGLENHNYFNREMYQGKFDNLWKELQKRGLVEKELLEIRNSNLFKYSPYKTLTDDQLIFAEELLNNIKNKKSHTYLVNGGPGTGKTILATYLIKQLVEKGIDKVALVIAMTPLRETLKKVFRDIPGLKSSMVIGPNEVTNKGYDVLIVDEAHRLRRRVNIVNYQTFDETNKKLGLSKESTELDWVLASAKQIILFFDKKQTVRPSDIRSKQILATKPMQYELKTQIRVKGGDKYLNFIDNLMEGNKIEAEFAEYDFRIYDDIKKMTNDIKNKHKDHGLSLLVAGFAWKWVSRHNPSNPDPDIVIGDTKLFWNSKLKDWPNSPNAKNEVGCIHTIQGYDLNYAGVIIGPEISYDTENQKITIKRENYFDTNGCRGVKDDEELKRYIINIYKTLLTRGIEGTYVYVCDKNLRNYFKQALKNK